MRISLVHKWVFNSYCIIAATDWNLLSDNCKQAGLS